MEHKWVVTGTKGQRQVTGAGQMGQGSFYKIPDGLPCAIQFSGGRTSGYMLHEILKANKPWPEHAHVLFQNTGREMPETLDFVYNVQSRFGVPVTWLEYDQTPQGNATFKVVNHNSASRNGEPFEMLIRKRKYVPNVVTRYCSDVLKYRTAKRYMRSLAYKKWTSAIGFRADEMTRVVKIHSRRHSREVIWTPLANAGVSKHDVKAFWDAAPFDLDLANIKGNTPLGNCDGCFLKSENNLANLARHYPERAAWWKKMESETGASFTKDRFWKSLINTVERSPLLAFEDGEFFCNSTYGSCEGF